MKSTFLVTMLTVTILSCNKKVEPLAVNTKTEHVMTAKEQYDFGLHYGVTDVQQKGGWFPPMWFDWRVGRLSIWLNFKQDNYWSSRADYLEFLFCDSFMDDLDSSDLVKIVDSTDNLAVKEPQSSKLYWKEQRYYTKYSEWLQLKTWNYTAPEYLLRFNANNFPAWMKVELFDRFLNTSTPIDVYENSTQWYAFYVEGDDVQFGIKANDPHRFAITVHSDW